MWLGNTEDDPVPPPLNSVMHYGVYARRGDALCRAHDKAGEFPVICLPDERPKPNTVGELIKLLEDDAWAESFQTLWQYREALLRHIRSRADAAVLAVAALSALPWEWL